MRSLLAVVVTLGVSACGGNSSSPSAPTTPTVRTLTISGAPASLVVGQSATLSANASLSSGSSQTVNAAWQSDSVAVSVDGNGLATGTATGSATITATYQGAIARVSIQSLTSYQGIWSGTYVVTTCDASGTW